MEDCSTKNQTFSSSSSDTIPQAEMSDSLSSDVHRALQQIQSDDPDLKLQATKEIRRLVVTQSCRRQLFGSIEPLVSMLQVDSSESHHESALRTLISLAVNEERNKSKIVEVGALEPIISFLQSQSLELQESATLLLRFLSTSAINKPVIVSSGAIPLLVKIFSHATPEAKMNAMKTLLKLSTDPNNLNIILGTNPIPHILNLLRNSNKSSTLAEMSCALLESLVGFDEGRTTLISEEGGMLEVIAVLEYGSPRSQEHVVGALLTMCTSDRCKYREPILKAGIFPYRFPVKGTRKFKSESQILFMLLRNSPYSQRVPLVELFHLKNGRWVDCGIHYVTIDYLKESKELGLLLISEEDGGVSLLHYISPDDIYERHNNTLIIWRNPTFSSELSFRFQETNECDYFWSHIYNAQNLKTSLQRFVGSTSESNDINSNVSSYQKVTFEWIFVIANFILELPSAVFDQLSSVQKPEYALIAMVMAFVAILICVIELLCKGQKERVTWRWRGRVPWFYYPPPSDKHFGTFADIVGFGCAIFQFVFTTINYFFICRNVDGPIKISVWPIIFTFGVLCSKLSENPKKTIHQD